jgi:hypothetical protein
VDVFWGRGPEAALAASDMKELGEFYVVVPKTTRLAEPSSGAAPTVIGTPAGYVKP